MEKSSTYLIIIRGNSGSGKTTLAKEVRNCMVEGGINTAFIEQDYFRRIILKEKENAEQHTGNTIKLIEQTARFALKRDYSVVLEGILSFERYSLLFERLRSYSDYCLIYYMDIPFEETLRRHATKPNAHEFGETEMRQWWRDQDLTRFPEEKIIPADNSLEQSVQFILSHLALDQNLRKDKPQQATHD